MKNDTLVHVPVDQEKEFSLSPRISKKSILSDYFNMTTFNKTTSLAFWKEPIVIHMSNDFSQDQKDDLKSFANQINNTNTVEISFTKRKENSNLFIINHNSVPRYYNKKFLRELDEFQKQKLLFFGSTYTIFRVDSELTNGYIKIDLDRFNDTTEVKRSLRRILYASLGFFLDSKKISENSLLNREFKDPAELSDYDKLLLQIHYDHLTDLKVKGHDLYQLYRIDK
ncbi:MAG: DUF2927 domain-containing protein [Nonlabens sp.]